MTELPQPNESMAFQRLIDALEEAASCARQLAVHREDRNWLAIDTLILHMRNRVIELAKSTIKH